MSAFAVAEIPGVGWLRKFKMIVLFSVNNECDFDLHCFYRDLESGYFLEKEIVGMQERLFYLWGLGVYFSWTNRLLLNLLFLLYLEQDSGKTLL